VNLNHREAIEEIEALTRRDELVRAAGLLVWTRGAFGTDAPDVFHRALSSRPEEHGYYVARAKLKWQAALDEEAFEDRVRALLVSACPDFIRHEATQLPDVESDAPWVEGALESVAFRLEGNEHEEGAHLMAAARKAPGEVALWVSVARLEQGTGTRLEIVALRTVLERARGWQDGWLRLLRALRQAGEHAAADRVLEKLKR
jgi:hypothetical protein